MMTIDTFEEIIVTGSTKKSDAVGIKLVSIDGDNDVEIKLTRSNAKYIRYALKQALKLSK